MRIPSRQKAIGIGAVVACLALVVWSTPSEQLADPDFDPTVAHPAYHGGGPRICFDAGHWNVHKADGRYRPFAELARRDGYAVDSMTGALTPDTLDRCAILVVANALGFKGVVQFAANRLGLDRRVDLDLAAFSTAEIAAVHDWIMAGGSALLIADHAPTGEAMRGLATAFAVGMSDRWAEEPKRHDPETRNWGFVVFSRNNGGLADHAITNGRGPDERITQVMTFTGQSLSVPSGAVNLLALSAEAREYPYQTGRPRWRP